jgi:hypothetical protein
MHALKKLPEATIATNSPNEWLVFTYCPTALFSLKTSRATSTVGKSLLIPTPYAVKMAFVDAALRHGLTHGLTGDAEGLIRMLAEAQVRIGVPNHACVTGTIQRVRQETRVEERKIDRRVPYYRPTIAMREVVSYSGLLTVAFDLASCSETLADLLVRAAPAINYFGKRGSFMQYCGTERRDALDESFTQPAQLFDAGRSTPCQIATLDDFGPGATFDALNSFAPTEIKRGVHRTFVETAIPFEVQNFGFGFTHYALLRRQDGTPR